MDIKQDPNSIPHFGGGGRIGEPSANEPEQAESSVELDQEDGQDAPSGAGHDALSDNRGATRGTSPPTVEAPTLAEGAGLPVDPSKTGAGSIDGLVGAP